MNLIRVVACLIERGDGCVLMVRKDGTERFMQPGGKPEPGETLLDALRRELIEELDVDLPADRFTPVGQFRADAANEPGYIVEAIVWRARIDDLEVWPRAEIAEARWLDPADAGVPLAPLSEYHLLPWLIRSRDRDS